MSDSVAASIFDMLEHLCNLVLVSVKAPIKYGCCKNQTSLIKIGYFEIICSVCFGIEFSSHRLHGSKSSTLTSINTISQTNNSHRTVWMILCVVKLKSRNKCWKPPFFEQKLVHSMTRWPFLIESYCTIRSNMLMNVFPFIFLFILLRAIKCFFFAVSICNFHFPCMQVA